MKMLKYLLFLALVVGLVGCADYYTTTPPNSYLRVGYDLSQVDQVGMVSVFGAVRSDVIRKQIENAFTAQILQKGYAPVVSEFLTRQLVQIQFDGAGMSPEVFAIEAGRALSYSTMLIVNVPNFSDEISVTAKLIDVESNSVIWIGQNSVVRKIPETKKSGGSWFNKKEDAYTSEFENAMMQYNAQPYQTESQGFSGMGQILTSEEERQVYELVAGICDSLPVKPLAWQPSPYQPQIPQYTPPVQSYAPASVPQPSHNNYVPAPTPTRVQPQSQVQQPVVEAQPQIEEPLFQPEAKVEPVKRRKTRKFRWRDLID